MSLGSSSITFLVYPRQGISRLDGHIDKILHPGITLHDTSNGLKESP
jgi:hypothetical protein